MEAELAERVGELVSELQGYQAREDKQLEELESFKKQLERAETSMQAFKSRIEADFVSREQVRRPRTREDHANQSCCCRPRVHVRVANHSKLGEIGQ